MLYGWKENSMLTNYLAVCAHLTITVSEIERDIGRKSSIFHMRKSKNRYFLPHFCFPWGRPLGNHAKCWYGKSRMVWLPDDGKISKISLFVLAQLTNVTDGQTPHHGICRAYAYASRGNNRIRLEQVLVCLRYFYSARGV